MVAVAECGTHAFVAAVVDAYGVGEETLAARLDPRLRPDELLTAGRGFYSWAAWDRASATGAALVWRPRPSSTASARAADGTYPRLIKPPGRAGSGCSPPPARVDLPTSTPSPTPSTSAACRSSTWPESIEYDVPDRIGNGTGELIVLLSTVLDPGGDHGARADELAPPTTNGGRKRPRTTSSRPTCAALAASCALA